MGLALLAVTLVAFPFASAGSMSWDTLASDLPHTVRGIDVKGTSGFAVGDGGMLLKLVGEEWVEIASPTTRDLHDVKLYDADHGVAVGAGGVVLDYTHRWAEADGHPDGVLSAYGATTLAGTTTRRVEWKMPLSVLGVSNAKPFGLGLDVREYGGIQSHPADLDAEAPASSERLRLGDVPTGSPFVDGEQEPAWASAVHASYPTGPVPFTLYLLRDSANLYALVTTTQALAGLTFQIHAVHGPVAAPGDLRLDRQGTSAPTLGHEKVGNVATWAVAAAPGALGVGDLLGAAFLSPGRPIAVGASGKVVIGDAADWVVQTLTSTKTLRDVDARSGYAYIVGSAATGDSGAILYRHDGSTASQVTLPTGVYGLHGIDLAGCRAVGSHGTILTCVDDDPTLWTSQTIRADLLFRDASHDSGDPDRVWVSGQEDDGDGALYRYRPDTGNWQRWGLPRDTPAVTALGFGLRGPMIGTLLDDILVLRAHAPRFLSVPTSASGPQGEPIVIPVSGHDEDGDPLVIEIPPIPGLPGDPPTIEELIDDVWRIIVVPPFDVSGIFNLTMILKDGDFEAVAGVPITIIDTNGPPVWDPHADVVIPHSVPYTTNVHATDPDGDPLTLTAPTLPPGALFSDLGGGDGKLDWLPGPGDLGVHPVGLVADDGALTDTLGFTITVVDNKPPIIDIVRGGGDICVKGPWWSGTREFYAQAHDPEGGPLTYMWQFSDDGSVQFGQQVYHTYTQIGVHTVLLTVTDDVGLTATRLLTVKADDCIHVEADLYDTCLGLIEQAGGWVQMFGHDGTPLNGTYQAEVWWWSPGNGLSRHVTTGPIVDGFAFFELPYDRDPVPLNDMWRHDVYIEGIYPDSALGDVEKAKVALKYDVQALCELVKVPPP